MSHYHILCYIILFATFDINPYPVILKKKKKLGQPILIFFLSLLSLSLSNHI